MVVTAQRSNKTSRRIAWVGAFGCFLGCVAASPLPAAGSLAVDVAAHVSKSKLPPEFVGTVTLTFDVTASESNSDKTPGHYDTSHLSGSLTLRPRQGSVSQMFDPYLYSATSAMSVTSAMARYAPQSDCQNYEFHYAPATGYPGFPAFFEVMTPEHSRTYGYPWGMYFGSIVGAQTNGCAGQDGNWPIVYFNEFVGKFLTGEVHNGDQHGGRLHLAGTKTVSLSSPAVVRYNKHACASDGVYYDPCVTSMDIRMDYDLQRISPKNPASQYPTMSLRNDSKGNDKVSVRTNTAVANTRVSVFRLIPGSMVMQSMGTPYTNRNGIASLIVKDKKHSDKTWFIAYVDGTNHVLAGVTTTQAIK